MLNSDNYTIYNTQPKALLSFIGTGKGITDIQPAARLIKSSDI